MTGPRKRKNRHGMTISDDEVEAILVVFQTIDRGGDVRILMRADALRRFRASLQRIKDGTRMEFGGRKRAPMEAPAADDVPDTDGSGGGPSMADRVLGMFDLEEDE